MELSVCEREITNAFFVRNIWAIVRMNEEKMKRNAILGLKGTEQRKG